MALLPSNRRDQMLMFVVVVAVVAIVGYYMYPYDGKAQEIAHLQEHVTALDSMNRQAKAEVAKGTAARLKTQLDQYARQVDAMRQLVPTGTEVPALLESISTAARRAGLELSEVAPQGVSRGDLFDTYRYKIGVTGSYHAIAEFLANIGSLPRIIAPINLQLTPSNRAAATKKKTESMLEAKFDVQTYVAHSSAGPALAGAPAQGTP